MQRDIVFLTDYKQQFYCPHHGTDQTMNLDRLAVFLRELGWSSTIMPFSAVDFSGPAIWKDRPVLYQSSQDQGLFYKSYIEDVILGLHLSGAFLVPRFELLRAHHNKCFMEILRTVSGVDALSGLKSRVYGNLQDFKEDVDHIQFPVVMKASAGDMGQSVALAHNAKEALKLARRFSFTPDLQTIRNNLGFLAKRQLNNRDSLFRGKFIVQPFIPGADADHRVHYFGNRWFILYRQNRPGDFRASGSRIPRTWPEKPPEGIIDFLKPVVDAFDVPFASLDVLHDGQNYHLLEFQFLRFGIKSLARAPFHWTLDDNGKLVRHEGNLELERLFAETLANYLERKS